MRKISQDQVSSINSLLNEVKSERGIAKIIGFSKSTVDNYIRMHLINVENQR